MEEWTSGDVIGRSLAKLVVIEKRVRGIMFEHVQKLFQSAQVAVVTVKTERIVDRESLRAATPERFRGLASLLCHIFRFVTINDEPLSKLVDPICKVARGAVKMTQLSTLYDDFTEDVFVSDAGCYDLTTIWK